jgi:hypothetical protein
MGSTDCPQARLASTDKASSSHTLTGRIWEDSMNQGTRPEELPAEILADVASVVSEWGGTATHVWHLMDFVDAAPVPELTPSIVEHLMEIIELQAGQAPMASAAVRSPETSWHACPQDLSSLHGRSPAC